MSQRTITKTEARNNRRAAWLAWQLPNWQKIIITQTETLCEEGDELVDRFTGSKAIDVVKTFTNTELDALAEDYSFGLAALLLQATMEDVEIGDDYCMIPLDKENVQEVALMQDVLRAVYAEQKARQEIRE